MDNQNKTCMAPNNSSLLFLIVTHKLFWYYYYFAVIFTLFKLLLINTEKLYSANSVLV